ncbi:MAG: hypothetical protein ABSG37_06845, partial [Candidatus Limnocylindrales bacterium]
MTLPICRGLRRPALRPASPLPWRDDPAYRDGGFESPRHDHPDTIQLYEREPAVKLGSSHLMAVQASLTDPRMVDGIEQRSSLYGLLKFRRTRSDGRLRRRPNSMQG